jgi:hypothetical protein
VTYIQLFGYHNLKASLNPPLLRGSNGGVPYAQRRLLIDAPLEVGFELLSSRNLSRADIVVANQGAWFDEPGREQNVAYFERFVSAIEKFFTKNDSILVWRTTVSAMPDAAALRVLANSSHSDRWQVLDVSRLVQNFPVAAADTVGTSTLKWDANHPYAFFYEEMIRLLLGYLKRPIDCKLLACAG